VLKKMILDKKKLRAIKLLVFSEKTKKEIAEELQITEQTLYYWLRDMEFNNLLASESEVYFSYIRRKTFKKLNGLLMKAFAVVEEALNSKDEKIRVKSAFNLLEVYAHYKNINWFNFRNFNELAGIVEGAGIGIDTNESFLSSDLSELLSFEDEIKADESKP
jgi:transposase-like protein